MDTRPTTKRSGGWTGPALSLAPPDGVCQAAETLVSGVPLRRGAWDGAGPLALRTGRGHLLQTQADVLARWGDGSAKWVLVTAVGIDARASSGRRLRLAQAAPPRRGPRISIRATPRGVTVDSGALRFTVARRGPLVPRFETRTAGAWQVRATGLDLTMEIDSGGTRAAYCASAEPREVAVECAGPLRAVIAVRGRHRAADGRTFGPYVLRVEVIAGARRLGLTHSVVYDGDPDRDSIRACGLVLRAEVGGDARFAFGGDAGREAAFARQHGPWHADYRHAELAQDSATHWRVRRWVDPARREVFGAEGIRSDGWMALAGRVGSLGAAVREFWQNHPKALGADAASGELRIELYPRRAEPLNLTRYSGTVYPLAYEAPCSWKPEVLPFDPACGAHGIRKTHDLALMFDEPNPSAAVWRLNHPFRLECDPEYLASTGVLVPAAPRVLPRGRAVAHRCLDFLAEAMLSGGGTGWVDYFDLPEGFNNVEGRWQHDYGGHGYVNNEGMPALGLWHAYFATGREDAFAMARAMSRHNSDIDSYHLGPWAGHGSRHNVTHWGDMCKEPRISQPIDKRLLYYLTGDRSVLDLVAVMMDMWRRRLARPAKLPVTAHVAALVSTLLTVDEAGREPVRDWLEALADALALAVAPEGWICALLETDATTRTARPVSASGPASMMMLSSFGGYQTYAELAERLGHQPLRHALVRLARHVAGCAGLSPRERDRTGLPRSPWLTAFRCHDLLAYAYAQTGDHDLVRFARRYGRFERVRIDPGAESRYGARAPGLPVPVQVPWPDESARDRAALRKYYPIPGTGTAQMFDIAVTLHKLNGWMLLMGAPARRVAKGR